MTGSSSASQQHRRDDGRYTHLWLRYPDKADGNSRSANRVQPSQYLLYVVQHILLCRNELREAEYRAACKGYVQTARRDRSLRHVNENYNAQPRFYNPNPLKSRARLLSRLHRSGLPNADRSDKEASRAQ